MNTSLSYPVKHSLNVPIEQFYTYGVNLNQYKSIDKEDEYRNAEYITRDIVIVNRYWLKFPPAWRTSEQKERIIGIRSIWLSEAVRTLRFNIVFEGQSPIVFEHILYCERMPFSFILTNAFKAALGSDKLRVKTKIIDNQYCIVVYTKDGSKFQFTDMNKDAVNVFNSFDEQGNSITETEMNDDTVAVFNSYITDEEGVLRPVKETELRKEWIFYDVWDREYFMVSSTIATNTNKNLIGFCGVRYMPIKYFKLSSNQTHFWVDLWTSHYMKCPVNLPRDGKDGFTLEVLFIHDNTDELYT